MTGDQQAVLDALRLYLEKRMEHIGLGAHDVPVSYPQIINRVQTPEVHVTNRVETPDVHVTNQPASPVIDMTPVAEALDRMAAMIATMIEGQQQSQQAMLNVLQALAAKESIIKVEPLIKVEPRITVKQPPPRKPVAFRIEPGANGAKRIVPEPESPAKE